MICLFNRIVLHPEGHHSLLCSPVQMTSHGPSGHTDTSSHQGTVCVC